MEVFTRAWDSHRETGCGVVLDAGVDPAQGCPSSRFRATRRRWAPGAQRWGPPEPMDFDLSAPPPDLGDGG